MRKMKLQRIVAPEPLFDIGRTGFPLYINATEVQVRVGGTKARNCSEIVQTNEEQQYGGKPPYIAKYPEWSTEHFPLPNDMGIHLTLYTVLPTNIKSGCC